MGCYADKKGHLAYIWKNLVATDHDYREDETMNYGNGDWVVYPQSINDEEKYYCSLIFCPQETFEEDGEEYFRTKYYHNGKDVILGKVKLSAWEKLINATTNCNEICLGMYYLSGENYSKMNCYAMRIYSKPLSNEEVIANYNATISYHDFLTNGGNASTSENTGGEDISEIE